MKDITKRHQARELALQVLFQKEFLTEDFDSYKSLDYFRGVIEKNNDVYKYAELLVIGVIEHGDAIDQKISSFSENWALKRMALVDLNILRIATFEIEFFDNSVPPKSSIDEAIEIAKKYSTTESASFINGILDQIYKSK